LRGASSQRSVEDLLKKGKTVVTELFNNFQKRTNGTRKKYVPQSKSISSSGDSS
jgi:hypothetical protein